MGEGGLLSPLGPVVQVYSQLWTVLPPPVCRCSERAAASHEGMAMPVDMDRLPFQAAIPISNSASDQGLPRDGADHSVHACFNRPPAAVDTVLKGFCPAGGHG